LGRVAEDKKRAASDVQRELDILRERAQALEREERERRDELIREIRAFEAVPVDRTRTVDPTATAGHGLLAEMSLLELQERLAFHRMRQAEEEEARRQEILDGKRERERTLMDKVQLIARVRAEETRTAVLRTELRHVIAEQQLVAPSAEIGELEKRLAERRAERVRVKTERSSRLQEAVSQTAGTGARLAKTKAHWLDVEDSLGRRAAARAQQPLAAHALT
jgi:hypothetical protein